VKITPIKTYFELSRVVKFLRDKSSNLKINDNFVPLVGINCSGIKYNDLCSYKCRANHYLKNALGVDELPPVDFVDEKHDIVSLANLCKTIGGQEEIFYLKKLKDKNFKYILDYITNLTLETMREKDVIKGSDKYFKEEQKKFLDENGYLIVPSILSEDEIEKLSKLTLLIAEKEDEAGVSYRYGGEDNNLQRIYNLISKHPAYIKLLEKSLVKEILEFYFEKDNLHHKYVLSSFQSNIIYPRGETQQLHVDGWGFSTQSSNALPDWSARLNVNFLLTDWTENNGATMLLPKSHKLFLVPNPEEVPDSKLTKIIAPKGSLVIWTGHTWHKSGRNNSDQPRFGLFACFAASQLKEASTEEEHLSVVDKEVMDRLSPEFRFMIGLDRGIKSGAHHRVDFSETEFKIEEE